MRYLFLLIFVAYGSDGTTQDLRFSTIDQGLLKKSNVVIRNSTLEFEVLNPGKAIKSYYVELTILNSTGKREAKQYIYYSNLIKILSFSGSIYNKEGKLVRKVKKSDVSDISASGSNMYTDSRLKVVDFSYPSYPYSIVFEYKVEHDGLMFYPNWHPQESNYNAVERSDFIIKVPEDLGLNFYEFLTEVSKNKVGSNTVYKWNVEGLHGFEFEPYGPPNRQLSPYVMTTPNKFEMEGFSGSMTTWESIGLYENLLLEGKNSLPADALMEIEKRFSGISDKRERAKQIYEFVQSSTRYVSIQLGIGGWQPYDARYVYENGYGDCKALTNYTASLLKQFEIESIYTSVRAGRGEDDIVTNFPNSRFNHVFLALPFESDTVWLECTSQTSPFGYTGTFTSDRHVLMATDEGGKLVKTPTYSEKQNVQKRSMNIILSSEGNATATIRTEYSGLNYEDVSRQLDESVESQKKWLLNKVNLDKTNIDKVKYHYSPGVVPVVTEEIIVTSANFGSVTGKRIFFDANPINKFTTVPREVKERKTHVYIKKAYTEIDSVQFVLPDGFHVEYLPNKISIENDFGEFSASYMPTNTGIYYVRKLVRKKGIHAPELYEDFRSMLIKIAKADKTKIVLVGST